MKVKHIVATLAVIATAFMITEARAENGSGTCDGSGKGEQKKTCVRAQDCDGSGSGQKAQKGKGAGKGQQDQKRDGSCGGTCTE
jgi:hypothetical protein